MGPDEAMKALKKAAPNLAADPTIAAHLAELARGSASPARRLHYGWLAVSLFMMSMVLSMVSAAASEGRISGGVITGVGLFALGARAAWHRARPPTTAHVASRQPHPPQPVRQRSASPPTPPAKERTPKPVTEVPYEFHPTSPFAALAQNPVLTQFRGERCIRAEVFAPDGRTWVFLVLPGKVMYRPADGQHYQTVNAQAGQATSDVARAIALDLVNESSRTVSREVLDGPWR